MQLKGIPKEITIFWSYCLIPLTEGENEHSLLHWAKGKLKAFWGLLTPLNLKGWPRGLTALLGSFQDSQGMFWFSHGLWHSPPPQLEKNQGDVSGGFPQSNKAPNIVLWEWNPMSYAPTEMVSKKNCKSWTITQWFDETILCNMFYLLFWLPLKICAVWRN